MTKQEKIAAIDKAMTTSKRDDGEVFNHFTDDAPRELTDLYLQHWEVKDVDYETFSRACDIVSEAYADHEGDDTGKDGQEASTDDEITDAIYERASDSASIMTYDRLQYLDNWNEGEIGEIMHEYGLRSVAEGAAIWYDRQVEQMAIIIKDWVNA